MTDTLTDALPREIKRIAAKRDRWIAMAKDHPDVGPGMTFTIAIMQAEIDSAVRACANGDAVEMLTALESLKGYSDDD